MEACCKNAPKNIMKNPIIVIDVFVDVKLIAL